MHLWGHRSCHPASLPAAPHSQHLQPPLASCWPGPAPAECSPADLGNCPAVLWAVPGWSHQDHGDAQWLLLCSSTQDASCGAEEQQLPQRGVKQLLEEVQHPGYKAVALLGATATGRC